jgi:plastocyanin
MISTLLFRLAGICLLLMVTLSMREPRPARTHEVRLERNRFTPAAIRARAGDSVLFVNGNDGLHNVQFEPDSMSAEARALITAAMTGKKIAPMSSPILILPGESYAMLVPPLAEGRYPLYCGPHLNMRGALIIER